MIDRKTKGRATYPLLAGTVFVAVQMSGEERIQGLLQRLAAAEARLAKLVAADEERKQDPRNCAAVTRVKADLRKHGIFSSRFVFVPSNYYSLTLEDRASLLATTTPQLCKIILFENTAWQGDDELERTNARYYRVVVQYIAKIDTQALRLLIHSQRPHAQRLSKNSFNFQLTSDAKSLELSGFEHNAIAPFGFVRENIPMVVDSRLLELQPPIVFLGGGHVDAKLQISVPDLIASTSAIVGSITELRS